LKIPIKTLKVFTHMVNDIDFTSHHPRTSPCIMRSFTTALCAGKEVAKFSETCSLENVKTTAATFGSTQT
jgi:hypothetical protein